MLKTRALNDETLTSHKLALMFATLASPSENNEHPVSVNVLCWVNETGERIVIALEPWFDTTFNPKSRTWLLFEAVIPNRLIGLHDTPPVMTTNDER